MNQCGKIKVRPLTELAGENETIEAEVAAPEITQVADTPQNKSKKKKAATTPKKKIHNDIATATTTKTEVKKSRFNRRVPLPGQLRIDSFYNSATKTFKIEPKIEDSTTSRKVKVTPRKPKRRRVELFKDDESSTTASDDKNFVLSSRKTSRRVECVIDLCSENETDDRVTALEPLQLHSTDDRFTAVEPLQLPSTQDAHNSQQTNDSNVNERVPAEAFCEVSLHTIEEDIIFHDDVVSKSPQTPPKSIQPQNLTATPKKADLSPFKMKNCVVWLQKSIKKSPGTAFNTPTATSTSNGISADTSILETKHKKKSTARELNFSAEKCNQSTKPLTRRQAKESISPQAINSNNSRKLRSAKKEIPTLSTGSTCPNTPKKEVIRKSSVLSPSDSNTSRPEKHTIKRSPAPSADTSSSKKLKSTKLLTPPESIGQCTTIAELIAISDEEQENVEIQKPTSSKKRKKPTAKAVKTETRKTPRPCPPYKVVEGTSLAVDAFRYGDIAGVTHYFLTHFHADHYVGLKSEFAHPIYMSSITARLLRVFIKIDEQYINELSLNDPVEIADVEVTAIDANHCPGAIMLIFKTREGRCILHTGDFRASSEMESEPVFWNNDIHTIYLDTTYFPSKYAFCAQSESIDQGKYELKEFNEKNVGTRILYVCGSYLIGKEKFWSAIAEELSLKVWTDVGRRKALNAINDENILSLLVDDPYEAHLHVIPMKHLSYFKLVEYIDKYSDQFDVVFALRPSGWEKNSKPQFRGKVNIVGIEYSEHSSHDEMKRFVQYLKPQKVISTVPVSHNIMKTARIPDNWYKYETLTGQKKFQPSISSYFKPQNGQTIQEPSLPEKPATEPSGSQMIVSPLEKSNGAVAPSNKASEKVEQKHNIFDAEEEDDWLT